MRRPPATLAQEFWLLTTGIQEESKPRSAVRCGCALATLRDLELAGRVRWVGHGVDLALDPVADRRADDPRPGHDALQAAVARTGGAPLPARFAIDPLLPDVWTDLATTLVETGDAEVAPRRLGATRYRAADPDRVRARRRELLAGLGTDEAPRDLAARDLDLFCVAWATGSVSALLRAQDVDPPDATLRAIDRATAGSALRAHGEAVMGFRGPAIVGDWGPQPL